MQYMYMYNCILCACMKEAYPFFELFSVHVRVYVYNCVRIHVCMHFSVYAWQQLRSYIHTYTHYLQIFSVRMHQDSSVSKGTYIHTHNTHIHTRRIHRPFCCACSKAEAPRKVHTYTHIHTQHSIYRSFRCACSRTAAPKACSSASHPSSISGIKMQAEVEKTEDERISCSHQTSSVGARSSWPEICTERQK